MQLSASRLKWIISLQQKKFREEHRVFVAEGKKVIGDLVENGWIPQYIVTGPELQDWADDRLGSTTDIAVADAMQMKKASGLSTPPGILAVFPVPLSSDEISWTAPVCLLLDGIGDPGNMGTILRTAHWFGVRDIFLDHHCTDPFAPKVVQATMGSLAKVRLHTVADSLALAAEARSKGVDICFADMEGTDYRSLQRKDPLLLVLGSESHGVSEVWRAQAAFVASIPPADLSDHPDSLNVAVSASVLLSHFCCR